MSIATNQSLLRGTRGKLGDLIIRQVKGKTVISTVPNPDAPQSALQKTNRNQFREASAFARAAMRDPEIKVYFQSEARRRGLTNGYTAALGFKMKDLKTAARDKDQVPADKSLTALSADISQPPTNAPIPLEANDSFRQLLEEKLGLVMEGLRQVTKTWDNIDVILADETQKEVLRTAVRLQLQETLKIIHLRSKAKAIQFKQVMPNFDHIMAVVDKT